MQENTKGQDKIAVLIEDHFDETEYKRFLDYLPKRGYSVEFLTRLWGNDSLTFKSNDFTEEVTVTKDVSQANPLDYKGVILIGAYAMDRLRYEENPKKGQPNQSPAMQFVRKVMTTPDIKLGTICHSLWMLTADPELLRGRDVTCAHNILYDVQNAGGNVVFDGDETTPVYVDGDLITAKHPGVVDQFLEVFVTEMKKSAVAYAV
jgi:putative intracellular protease/amidase